MLYFSYSVAIAQNMNLARIQVLTALKPFHVTVGEGVRHSQMTASSAVSFAGKVMATPSSHAMRW